MSRKYPKRKKLRLKDYNYASEGAYFITICTRNRRHLFSNVNEGSALLNLAGKMVEKRWQQLASRFPNIKLDEFIIMPNHIHGIIMIVGAPLVGARNNISVSKRTGTRPAPTLGNIICAFKSITTNDYIHNVKHNNWPGFSVKLWQ